MPSLPNQIILVTGATSGIGKVTATKLAQMGARVVLLARSAEKAEATQREIKAVAGHDQVDVLLADLADLAQVRRAAAEFNARYPRLDVLVNNAGLIFGAQRQLSVDGNELGLATNHLGPFLLTALLLDKLRASPAARVVNLASMAYHVAKPNLADIQSAQRYSAMRVYGNTKLYNIMFTQELARRLRAHGISNVTANALHPGVVASNFGASAGGWLSKLSQLGRPFMISVEKGAETSIFLSSSPEVAAISGGYFDKQKPVAVKHSFNTADHARQLWEASEQLTGTQFLA
ncbi:SDR family NAD(P)-dependent oxidoreductase [Hymenobacter sp. BT683]|uniref:SDR family NAD(P)-dependent oxidoreductase n=1 Tax=Hymenobacter jeongseonensis TaxID=2791027 RepID=A0ABS0IHV5_9BACT|nr:SDR family NAD(P)-dependent oxidoreductase [Hymenobacter jeongseonensis]MBF9237928.1 SDR family NAD(P)-dependent oxidoreductase [Hymenobacter jeongseonensis]